MGGIDERPRKDGTVMYRVRIRAKGIPFFSLTFDDREYAAKWLDAHEELFVKDPDYYFAWRDNMMRQMRANKLENIGNIIKPWKRLIK